MKKTHILFDFKRKDGGKVPTSEPPKITRGHKKVHPHPSNILPVERPHNPVPSTSRDARLILDPFQIPTYQEPQFKVRTLIVPRTNEDEGVSRDVSVSQSESNSSVADVESEAPVVFKKVKLRRMVKRRLAEVVEDANLKMRNVPQKDSVDEWKRKEGETLITYRSRLIRLRFKNIHDKLQSSWKSLKETKEKWDKWNPDKSHPLVKCINESKMSGLKETIRHNRGIFWRLNWLMTWALAISSGITFCVSAYYFHQHFPILFGFKTKQTPIRKVPFVTVTVCPYDSFNQETIALLEKLLTSRDLTKDDFAHLSQVEIFQLMIIVDHICSSKSTLKSFFDKEKIFNNKLYNFMKEQEKFSGQLDMNRLRKIRYHLAKISTPRKDFLEMCVWNTETDKDCTNFFRPKLTSNGICYTFNAMPPKELYTRNEAKALKEDPEEEKNWTWNNWNLDEHGTNDDHAKGTVGNNSGPRTQPTGGSRWGLKFKIRTENALSGNCHQFDGLGPRVFVSVPGLDLDESKLAVSIPPNSDVTVKLYPDMTLSDPEIVDIEPERRGCLFQREKKLTYYKKYTQENCLKECVANYAADTCGCTLLSFPNFPGKPLCLSKEGLDCLKTVEENLFRNNVCSECLPSCSQMTIRDEVMSTLLSEASRRIYSGNKNESFSIVSMFYAEDSIVAKERQRRFSKYELISVFGSIFETTNDLSLLGFARTAVGLSELKPLVATLLKLTWTAFKAKVTNMHDLIKKKLGLAGVQDPVLPLYDRSSNDSNA